MALIRVRGLWICHAYYTETGKDIYWETPHQQKCKANSAVPYVYGNKL